MFIIISVSSTTNNFHTYLPISENNLRWDLYLTGVGAATIGAGEEYPPKGHPHVYTFRWETGRVLPEYQIVLIAEGEGIFEWSKSSEIKVQGGDVIFLFPGVWHRYRPLAKSGWKEYWLSWNGERLYRLMKKGVISPSKAVVRISSIDETVGAFERIIKRVDHVSGENSNILSAYAMEVLALALDNVVSDEVAKDTPLPFNYAESVDDPIVFKALQIIWNHSYRDFQIDKLVRTLPVTRRTLERKFKSSMGYSIGSEITRCRLERAKDLLSNTELPVKHIALAAGFSGSDWMGKVFKNHLSMTPVEYRKKRKSFHPS